MAQDIDPADHYNRDLLALMPRAVRTVVEVGCAAGALARAFKQQGADCQYWGIEVDSAQAALARRHCDEVFVQDIEAADAALWQRCAGRECWVFGDTLEHLREPWTVLRQVRQVIASSGVVVASLPNAQHWSLQARLSVGDFRYQPSGLLDRTHLRWFTRQTMLELFHQAGFEVQRCEPRIFDEPARAPFLPLIAQMAQCAGADVKQAMADALPLQYVLRAVPRP